MTGVRSALIVACDGYADPGLGRLRAPASDARALEGVLQDPAIGGFDVKMLLNAPAYEVALAIEEFFADRVADDLLLLHLSCHGVKDEDGELYFAMANTALRRLAATGVAADFVNRRMNRSRSRRVVLLLDCCYAGAFERGMTARAGAGVGIESQFGGRGRAVITASSAMEYAFEGDQLADASEVAPSVFTSALVEGLRSGEADRDQDGLVSLDELYDYIYDRVRAATPNQTPGKWTFGVQGELVIARRARPVTQPAPLPAEVQEAIDSPLAAVRTAAVQELSRLLGGKHAGRALAARQVLEELADDDSRTVAAAAAEALSRHQPADGGGPAPITAAEPAAEGTAPEPAAERTAPEPPADAGPEPPADAGPEPPADAEPEPTAKADLADAAPEPAVDAAPEAAVTQKEPVTVPEPEPDSAAETPSRAGLLPVATGVAAIAAGVLLLASVFPPFLAGTFHLADRSANTWQNVIGAVAVAAAGALLMARSSRRLTGPGFMLGAIATAPSGAVEDVIVGHKFPPAGPGLWLNLVGCVILTITGCVVWRALARQHVVRAGPRLPSGALAWLVAVTGAAGAALLIAQVVANEGVVPGAGTDKLTSGDAFALIWTALAALLLPALAASALPRTFGIALLCGWLTAGLAEALFYTNATTSLFGLTLIALIGLTVALAANTRRGPAVAADRAAPAD